MGPHFAKSQAMENVRVEVTLFLLLILGFLVDTGISEVIFEPYLILTPKLSSQVVCVMINVICEDREKRQTANPGMQRRAGAGGIKK